MLSMSTPTLRHTLEKAANVNLKRTFRRGNSGRTCSESSPRCVDQSNKPSASTVQHLFSVGGYVDPIHLCISRGRDNFMSLGPSRLSVDQACVRKIKDYRLIYQPRSSDIALHTSKVDHPRHPTPRVERVSGLLELGETRLFE